MSGEKNWFFAKHAKSSAAIISLGIHVLLLIVALSYVAVRVIIKEDQVFEANPLSRPKMQMKKLQVPVNVKKKTQKPKLRKRIVAQPKMNQVPDIKMPELTGVKGGLGTTAGDGLGGGGSLGFAMPEMNLFGIKSRGEKIFIILDASSYMMVDNMGGIAAYTIIKSELVRILEGLNSSVLFNIAVYGDGNFTLFPGMVPATSSNVDKVDAWLKPLNIVKKGMKDSDYGPKKTLGPGGTKVSENLMIAPLKSNPGDWAYPTLLAMKQQADVVFLLTCRWGRQNYKTGENERSDWTESDQDRYEESLAKARELFKEDNDRRRAKGEPPRVIAGGNNGLLSAYVPGAPRPPSGVTIAHYSPETMVEAFGNMREKLKSEIPVSSGLFGKKQGSKDKFTINVIHFVNADSDSTPDPNLSKIASETRGEYRKIKGLEAIQSYVSLNSAQP